MNKRPFIFLTKILIGTYFIVASTAFSVGLSHAKFDKDSDKGSHSCPWFWQVKSSVGLPTLPPVITPHWTITSVSTPDHVIQVSWITYSPAVRGPPTRPFL